MDTDSDAVGDNADTDDDGDGVPDGEDAFPLDPGESVDTDNDGTANNTDADDDGDGITDAEDGFPLEEDGALSGQISRPIAANPALASILGPARALLLALGL